MSLVLLFNQPATVAPPSAVSGGGGYSRSIRDAHSDSLYAHMAHLKYKRRKAEDEFMLLAIIQLETMEA